MYDIKIVQYNISQNNNDNIKQIYIPQQLSKQMQPKASTDIDRKLAIYYHPLFQQIIKLILDLFNPIHSPQYKFQIGILQFVQFNLKLQKALLPTFELDNALISGLNDWVKQVAQCLTFQGMVSTTNCVQVTTSNIMQLIGKQYSISHLQFFQNKQRYLQIMNKLIQHDAFKLLGVRINKQVFSKFMFDLCSTWCQFLDVQLFSYFLIGLYIQISKGQNIKQSIFKHTKNITTIDIQFMEEFQEIKNSYNQNRKKQLRYYRAWCEWNYLRVNQAGERLILKLDQIHNDDNRILELALVFEKAIKIINQEITSQNPLKEKQENKKKSQRAQNNKSKEENRDFLILKKLSLQPNQKQKQAVKLKKQDNIQNMQSNQTQKQKQNQNQKNIDYSTQEQSQEPIQDFQIQIDQNGNMYLKRIVKLPVFGTKIMPRPHFEKANSYKEYIEQKNKQYRKISNLYGKMQHLKVRLQHNSQNDPYTFKKNALLQQRQKFYAQQQKGQTKISKQLQKTIHQKNIPSESQKQKQGQRQPMQLPFIKKQQKISLRQQHQYIHKVMAPSFLTDNANNLSYQQIKQGQIYANNANDEKRQLRIGLPKLKNMEFRVKQIKSYHIVGKLTNDRSLINDKVRSASISLSSKQVEKSKLEKLKQQNQHIWKRYISDDEIKQLNNYQEFYDRLNQAKKKFGMEFQSQFRINLVPMLAYENKRHQLGGILTKEDKQRFSVRMAKLINKQNRRNKKKARKQKLRVYRNNFKSKRDKTLFQDIFINYHKQAIKQIKVQRKRHASMIAP